MPASGAERAVVEGLTGRRILAAPTRQAIGRTRDPSPRQLPTDHDYAGAPRGPIREYQSDQPSMLPFDRRLLCSTLAVCLRIDDDVGPDLIARSFHIRSWFQLGTAGDADPFARHRRGVTSVPRLALQPDVLMVLA